METRWRAVESLSARGDGDRAAGDTILDLELDDGNAPESVASLLHALRVAQVALRGERSRNDAVTSSKMVGHEMDQLKEKLRVAEDELAEVREERDELTEDLAALERKDRQRGLGGRRSIGAGGTTAQEQRTRIEELESENRELRTKNKDLVREAGRKDEIIDARMQALEEQRAAMQVERDEKRQLEEDVRVMRSQIRDYRDKLENTSESVMAREERNREGNKQLRQKTREINQLLAENSSLRKDIKERDDDLHGLAVTLEKLKSEKAERDAEAEESARLVNSLERQVSSLEASEAAINRKVEKLQAEMDEEEEANEEEKREYDRLIKELHRSVGEHKKAIDDRDIRIKALESEVERHIDSQEVLALRAELEAFRAKLDMKEEEVEAARRGEAEGQARKEGIQAAVRAVEGAAAQRLAEESKRHAKAETESREKIAEATSKLELVKGRHASLSEKFAQREDVIVELRARMDEYERGVHGLREEVQEKQRFKALHEQRSEEVRAMTLERNRRESELQELFQEVAWLRGHCSIQPGDPKYMDLSQLKLQSQIELQQLQSQVLAQEDELQTLEKERTRLLKKLRVEALARGERAAREAISVEKLAAMEEIAADLEGDPDFADVPVGSARARKVLAPVEQQVAADRHVISSSFAQIDSLDELRRRGTALHAELTQKGAALQEAEAASRKAAREKASLIEDRQTLEATVDALHAQINSGAVVQDSAQGRPDSLTAALMHQNEAMRAAVSDASQAIQDAINGLRQHVPEQKQPQLALATGVAQGNCDTTKSRGADVESMATVALAAAAEQLDVHLVSLKDLVKKAHPARAAADSPSPRTACVYAADGRALQLGHPTMLSVPSGAPARGGTASEHHLQPPAAGVAGKFVDATAKQQQPAPPRQRGGDREIHEARLRSFEHAPATAAPMTIGLRNAGLSGRGDGGNIAFPPSLSEEGLLGGGRANGSVGDAAPLDPFDVIAALNAQLIESKAMLGGQQSQLVKAEREVRKYRAEMAELHEQQTYLYASHVREVKAQEKERHAAEKRADAAERLHAEDVVRIESWKAMADALEATGERTGDEGQRRAAEMGRRLTSLRVREMELARTSQIQTAELCELRSERMGMQAELRQSQVESAAEAARLERCKRELTLRLECALEELDGSVPRTELDVERKEKERVLRAYKGLAEQAARTASSAADAARFESQATTLAYRLQLTEAALDSANKAEEERIKALEDLTTRLGEGEHHALGHSRSSPTNTAMHRLEAQLQSLRISEAGALSRAETAERVLDAAMKDKRELAERLQVVEKPVGELTERLCEAEAQLDALKTQPALGRVAALPRQFSQNSSSRIASQPACALASEDEVSRLRKELEMAKEEALRAKEIESIATTQVSDIASRQAACERECTQLRDAITQLQITSDDAVETGQLQWAVLQARRAEGEARRREAAASTRRNHAQAAVFRLQLKAEHAEAALHGAKTAARDAEVDAARSRSALTAHDGETTRIENLMALRDKMQARSEETEKLVRQEAELRAEREDIRTELAVASARDEDQRALLNGIASAAQKGEHAQLLEPPPVSDLRGHRAALLNASPAGTYASAQSRTETSRAQVPITAGVNLTVDSVRVSAVSKQSDADIVSFIALFSAKTDLKVSELRLKRRVASLELSELDAVQRAKEANSRREEVEEELLRTKEEAMLAKEQGGAREAKLASQISQLRQQLIQRPQQQKQQKQAQELAQEHVLTRTTVVQRSAPTAQHAENASRTCHHQASRSSPPLFPQAVVGKSHSILCDGHHELTNVAQQSSLGDSSRNQSPPVETMITAFGVTANGGDVVDSVAVLDPMAPGLTPPAGDRVKNAADVARTGFFVAAGGAPAQARAEVLELASQLSESQSKRAEYVTELRELRIQLAAVRSELANSEDALVRAESRHDLQLAQRLSTSIASSNSMRGALSPHPATPLGLSREQAVGANPAGGSDVARAAHQLLTERAEAEQRHASKLALAEESLRSLQAQLRRKDTELQQVTSQLAEAREANRKDKARTNSDADRLAQRLDQQNEELIQRGRAMLQRLTDDGEPVAKGTELTVREIELENERKEALISQLQAELHATNAELNQSRAHLHERLAEIETLSGQLGSQKARQPTDSMSVRVQQLNALLKSKERELTKLREALATVKEEMLVLAVEHTERMTRVSERAARAEARTEADVQTKERMLRLQERLRALVAEVRSYKQRDEEARRLASEASEAARAAEGLASRTSADLVRANSETESLKATLADMARHEEALKRQLAARTEQLDAIQKRALPPGAATRPTSREHCSLVCGGDDGGQDGTITTGDQAAAVAEAVAKAVIDERERWLAVRMAVEDVQAARQGDSKQGAAHAAQLAQSAAITREAERVREEALLQVAHLRKALVEAEERHGRQMPAKVVATAPPATDEDRSMRATVDERGDNEARAATALRSSDQPTAIMPLSRALPSGAACHGACDGGASTATSLAVERWTAEKNLQRKVDKLRTKVNDKTRELAVAESELAKAHAALDAASQREAALREGMLHAQEQVARLIKEREGALASALNDMRSREQLSAELYRTQQDLSQAQATIQSQRHAADMPKVAACSDAEYGVGDDELSLSTALLQRDQRLLQKDFELEAHELTVAQLQARLRDQAAYQAVLASAAGVGEPATYGGGTASQAAPAGVLSTQSAPRQSRPRSEGAGADGVGRRELSVVVEKMEHVIDNLRTENAELRRRAVTNVKFVELAKENKTLKAQVEVLTAKHADLSSQLAAVRAQASDAAETARELVDMRRQAKIEADTVQELRSKLAELHGATTTAAETAAAGTGAGDVCQVGGDEDRAHVQPLEMVKEQLDDQLRGARSESRALRSELMGQGALLVEMGSQLHDALGPAAATEVRERKQAELLAATERDKLLAEIQYLRSNAMGIHRRPMAEEESLHAHATAAAEVLAAQSVAAAVAAENATLRAEKAALASELLALSPQFFEEVEDLKYAYVQTRQQLNAYVQAYGVLQTA